MASKIIFIIGAGQRIGAATAKRFAADGYQVALASRSVEAGSRTPEGYYNIKLDVSKPAEIEAAFARLHRDVGVPNVVFFNASSATFKDDPLDLTLDEWQHDLNVNVLSQFVAIQQAVKGIDKLGGEKLTYLATGNKLNAGLVLPVMTSGGVGKSGLAHLLQAVARVHGPKGLARFYYVDERTPEGDAAFKNVDGEAHADYIAELVKQDQQGPVLSTFAKGVGYHKWE
ncbi:short-chain dehydrogenase reductase like yusS [Pseudohyphozyma bogoriensis]|nr:short-chain dehydrogenase reductase like yusS [Pseudohyphozyma bogoriensis]